MPRSSLDGSGGRFQHLLWFPRVSQGPRYDRVKRKALGPMYNQVTICLVGLWGTYRWQPQATFLMGTTQLIRNIGLKFSVKYTYIYMNWINPSFLWFGNIFLKGLYEIRGEDAFPLQINSATLLHGLGLVLQYLSYCCWASTLDSKVVEN